MAGLIVDTSVFVAIERAGLRPDFSPWASHGQVGISTITASEMLVGVLRASPDARRSQRSAFVEGILAAMPIHPFDLAAARVYAHLFVTLTGAGTPIGVPDLVIASTALALDAAVLTANVAHFTRVPDLNALPFQL